MTLVLDTAPIEDRRPAGKKLTVADAYRRRRIANVLGYVAMAIVIVVIALPLVWVFFTSFKQRTDIYTRPTSWWPPTWYFGNYSEGTSSIPFWKFLRNSTIITLSVAGLKFVFGTLSAYGLVFLRFPGKNVLFLTIIAALMVPNQITLISNYVMISDWGWRNTFPGIIIPLSGVAFGTFLMRNHFLSLPKEVIEAARMDNAGPLRLLFRVVLPMSGPTMVAFGVIAVVDAWNEYLWPYVMSDGNDVAPIPIGLTYLQNNDGVTNWGPVMAVVLLAMLPMLAIFLVLQRNMIKGLTSGAVKG